jgi:uncharacterized membrane protein
MQFAAIGILAGGIIATTIFALSVFAAPMLLDRDIDVVTAMIAARSPTQPRPTSCHWAMWRAWWWPRAPTRSVARTASGAS